MSKKIHIVLILLVILGVFSVGRGLWIPAKAVLAQRLLDRAWKESQKTGEPVKPWPWADTFPVARLTLARLGIDMIVLEGTSGETLAFGPGLLAGSVPPGEAGQKILYGHRDTSFAFLKEVQDGDTINLNSLGGGHQSYTVTARVLKNVDDLYFDPSVNGLSLVTCFPFDGIKPHTKERFVVMGVANSG